MKLQVLINNHEVVNHLKQELELQLLNEIPKQLKGHLLLEHNEENLQWILDYHKEEGQHIFYYIDYEESNLEQIITICHSRDIHPITTLITSEQLTEKIIQKLKGVQKQIQHKVVGVFATLPNIGTTTIVKKLASQLVETTKLKIAIIGLNVYSPGITSIEYEGKTIDQIKNSLEYKNLERLPLESYFQKEHGYYYLAGNQNLRLERQYSIEEIKYLIEYVSQQFDVVFLDAGSYFDHASSVQALEASSMKLLVTVQDEKALEKYRQLNDQLFRLLDIDARDFHLIINQYQNNEYLSSISEIYKQYQVSVIGKLPFDLSIRNRMDMYGTEYYKEIRILERFMIKQLNLPTPVAEKQSLLKRLWGK